MLDSVSRAAFQLSSPTPYPSKLFPLRQLLGVSTSPSLLPSAPPGGFDSRALPTPSPLPAACVSAHDWPDAPMGFGSRQLFLAHRPCRGLPSGAETRGAWASRCQDESWNWAPSRHSLDQGGFVCAGRPASKRRGRHRNLTACHLLVNTDAFSNSWWSCLAHAPPARYTWSEDLAADGSTLLEDRAAEAV